MKTLRTRALTYGLLTVLGLLCALPNLFPSRAAEWLPASYVNNTVALGLDLQGGSHLLLTADFDEMLANKHEQLAGQLAEQLREAGIRYAPAVIASDGLTINIRDDEALSRAADIALAMRDDQGTRLLSVSEQPGALQISLSVQAQAELKKDAIERSLEVLRRRLNESGLVEPSITRQGSDGILVQMPGVEDPSEIRTLLGTTAKMQFHWVADRSSAARMTLTDSSGAQRYTLERHVALEGEHIRDAQLAFSQDTQAPVVNFQLDGVGARLFGDMTQNNVGRALAIVLDDTVLTAPVIRGVIAGGSGEISGHFTVQEARELALLLRAGALPVPLEVIEERTVGPDLGSDAIEMGLSSGLIGAGVVLLLMFVLYGAWGLIPSLSLAINVGLIFGLLSLLGATLTLPGIAGIILTIGMAVDANILINERIKEETRQKAPAKLALRAGFDRAFSTIVDSSVTTLIAVSLLFLVGNGPVRGFAVTIGIGLLTSLFTTVGITRLLMELWIRGREREPLRLSGLAAWNKNTAHAFPFLKGRVLGLALSALLSLAAIGLYVKPGLEYGIDFTGGTLIETVAEDVSVEQLRGHLAEEGFEHIAIQEFGEDNRYLLRVIDNTGKGSDTVEALKQAVSGLQPEASFPRVDMVGPKVSDGFSDATLLAILLAGAGIMGYLWLRFESHFALAATLTIALDLTKTIGFFALTGIEFNLTAVAALLALIGYSVNDKVVIFDRIREALRGNPEQSLEQTLNESVNSVLSRTLYTSVTTFLALIPMGLVGGTAVSSFALPMLFGVVIGTSSSLFVAVPILYYLSKRRQQKGLPQLRPTQEALQAELDLLP